MKWMLREKIPVTTLDWWITDSARLLFLSEIWVRDIWKKISVKPPTSGAWQIRKVHMHAIESSLPYRIVQR